MKLGFVTAIVPELNLEETMQLAAAIGYDCIEVMCWPPGKAERRYAGVTHLDVTEFGAKEAEKVQSLIKQYGVSISSLGFYPNALSPVEEEAEVANTHIRKLMDASVLLGINQITTFIGRDWTKSVKDNWPKFLEVWKPLIALAEEKEVFVGIENCPMWFTNDEYPGGKNLKTTPAIFRKMYEDIPSPYFGLNFDPSHFIWQQMDYLNAIKEFAPKFSHVHAKDVRMDWEQLDQVGIMANPSEYHTPKLPGMGDVNWSKFFSYLTDAGYDGAVCVEVEDRSFEGSLEMRKRSLVQSHDYLRQFVPREVLD
ncbi:MAG: sugar phosphate isomerase/epimerase family protein [Cytophagales bacterium]|nr:sugar phosphate isomerase/epimerase family protein [Cytophagales bacterium]